MGDGRIEPVSHRGCAPDILVAIYLPLTPCSWKRAKKAVMQRAWCEVALPEGNEVPLGLIPHYWSSHLRPGVSPSAKKLVAPYSWPRCFPNPVLPSEEEEI